MQVNSRPKVKIPSELAAKSAFHKRKGQPRSWRTTAAAYRLIIFKLTCMHVSSNCHTPTNSCTATLLNNMSEERRPRSRFDSDGTERPARSRFDTERRSRSPPRREPESHRARSPIAREASDSPSTAGTTKNKAAAAAAAAAARINAQIQAKKGIQHVDVPPIRSVSFLFAFCAAGRSRPLTVTPRCPLLQSSSRLLLGPVRLSPVKRISKTGTISRTLKSMICVIATH